MKTNSSEFDRYHDRRLEQSRTGGGFYELVDMGGWTSMRPLPEFVLDFGEPLEPWQLYAHE